MSLAHFECCRTEPMSAARCAVRLGKSEHADEWFLSSLAAMVVAHLR